MTIHEGHDTPVFGCDDCIKAAGPRGDMPTQIYHVEVYETRTDSFYVEASSREEAEQIAKELDYELTFESFDIVVSPAGSVPSGALLWSGDDWV